MLTFSLDLIALEDYRKKGKIISRQEKISLMSLDFGFPEREREREREKREERKKKLKITI